MAKRFRSDKGPSQRQLRAGEVIRHALVDILSREELRDPDLDGVSLTISEVRPSPDLRHATVFCAPLGGGDARRVASAMNRVAPFLRGRLGGEIALKFTPQLHFQPDVSFDEASRMNALFSAPGVARDLDEARGPEGHPDPDAATDAAVSPRDEATD